MKRNRSVGENDDKKIKSETGQRDEKRREREFGLHPGLFFCLFCFDFFFFIANMSFILFYFIFILFYF